MLVLGEAAGYQLNSQLSRAETRPRLPTRDISAHRHGMNVRVSLARAWVLESRNSTLVPCVRTYVHR